MIEIVRADGLVTVQDAGRIGQAALGVGRSGAFDRGAWRLANRLVGNPIGAACLELSMGEFVLALHDAVTIALTGAARTGAEWGVPVTVPAGALLSLGRPVSGLRSYLAVRGGIAVGTVLGSRSTDTLSGLGPAPLAVGDRLAVGDQPDGEVASGFAVAPVALTSMRIVPGPRDDWFAPAALATLRGVTWTVRPDSDRVGIRLDGPALPRVRGGELPSEAMLPGALQVPPDGRPILLGPDAPVTGGYPVIAVVRDADLDIAAQLRPGDPARFR